MDWWSEHDNVGDDDGKWELVMWRMELLSREGHGFG